MMGGRIDKLSAERVSVHYRQQGRTFVALEDVSLTVADGEFVAIVGPSGCGKSTFLMAVDGLVPLAKGRIFVDGVAVRRPGPDRAVAFQDASLLPWRTILRNVSFGLEMQERDPEDRSVKRRAKAERDARARDLIKLVGLADFEQSYPLQLSGGMQQRVNLARALAVNPKLLLLDEPFASLDAQTREVMQEELLRIWDSEGSTTLLVTHQIDEAVFLSDRVIVFGTRPGRVLEEFVVPFPRPRSSSLRQEDEFVRLTRAIWSLVRQELSSDPAGGPS